MVSVTRTGDGVSVGGEDAVGAEDVSAVGLQGERHLGEADRALGRGGAGAA